MPPWSSPWIEPWGHHFPSPVVFRLTFPVCLCAASSPRLTLFCFFERLILPALELPINGITQYVILCISFFFIQHNLLDSSRLFVLFCCCIVFLLKCHNRFVYLLGYLVWEAVDEDQGWLSGVESELWTRPSLLIAFLSACTLPWEGRTPKRRDLDMTHIP